MALPSGYFYQFTHEFGTATMGLEARIIEMSLVGVALRDIPVKEGIDRRQPIVGALVVSRSVGFVTRPSGICMNQIRFFQWPAIAFYGHTENNHQFF